MPFLPPNQQRQSTEGTSTEGRAGIDIERNYVTVTLSYDVDVVSDQSLALLHVWRINSVSDQTFGLRLKFETLVSAKDKVTVFLDRVV